mmetsp:Transcript_104840/g.291990  ORF Transcript_104840/g.291990 Transcript_104840/m.291990 type:complete len:431 (+) Transcript_104840:185-1477(+)
MLQLRGPCRQPLHTLCLDHDPRGGRCCLRGAACSKEHLDTFDDESARRYDSAMMAWNTALERHKGRSVGAACGLQPSDPTVPSQDLPIPKGVHDVPWYYDDAWHRRASSARLISVTTFLVHMQLWSFTPRLRRFRELDPGERLRFGEVLGKRMGSLSTAAGEALVLCVEKPYMNGFVAGLKQTMKVPFVLLVVNGGDAPLTLEHQDRIAELPHIRACFAMNLHLPRHNLFYPLPIGLPHHADGLCRGKLRAASNGEAAIHRVRTSAKPWACRDRRLLIAPMQANRLRSRYTSVLSGKEYGHLVRIVSQRLCFEAFLALLSEHQSTLSPPGKGHDCYRTWQAISVGTVPLVTYDEHFDPRLYEGVGPRFIPKPDDLTPDCLEQLLSQITDPAGMQERLEVQYWTALWTSYLQEVPCNFYSSGAGREADREA